MYHAVLSVYILFHNKYIVADELSVDATYGEVNTHCKFVVPFNWHLYSLYWYTLFRSHVILVHHHVPLHVRPNLDQYDVDAHVAGFVTVSYAIQSWLSIGCKKRFTPLAAPHVQFTTVVFGALQVASAHIHHSHLHVQLYSPSFQFGSLFTIDDDLVHKLFADGYTVVATQLVDALHCASA
jgi:hypothetical protein